MSEPTVLPAVSFDPESDASALRKAMKGLGTDEAAIINILANRTYNQRHEICKYYNNSERNLITDLRKELSGNFKSLVIALMTPLEEFLASELNDAMEGVGTNEQVLIEILCTRDNASLRAIKKAYEKVHEKDLKTVIKKETSDDLEKLLLDLCNCDREEGLPRPDIAPTIAAKLYRAGEGRKGADEDEIRRILANYSYGTLRLAFDNYRKETGNTLGEIMEKELEGDFKTGMLTVYNSIQNTASFFAEALHKAMAGAGTKDRALIRVIVSRSEIDMANIKHEYQTIYNRSLAKDIKGDTSGYYEKLLLALIKE